MLERWITSFILLVISYYLWKRKWRKPIEDEEESLFSENMTEFEKAISFINAGKCRLSDAAKLALYGLYKQATVGDNTTPSPSAVDLIGSAKWKSWKSYTGLSKAEAENKYVDFVTKLVPQWKEADQCDSVETTETNVASSEGGFGIKVSTMKLGTEEDWEERSDIFSHCANGDMELVLKFIDENPSKVNEVDEEGRSLFHWACDRGDITIVRKLIECGADSMLKDRDDLLPLDYACICQHYDIIDLMKEHGAKLEDCQPDSLEFLEYIVFNNHRIVYLNSLFYPDRLPSPLN